MTNDFDRVIDRLGTESKKWEHEEEVLPFSIADMEFKAPVEVIDEITARAEHGIYGYTYRAEDYYDSIINWGKRRYDLDIRKEEICHSPGIVTALSLIVNTYTAENDAIIIQSPVYYPFMNVIKNNKRKIVSNNLVLNNDKYEMDFNDLKDKIISSNAKVLLLCNPHNPVGRVWTKTELIELGNLCLENNVLVVSDEVHSDIIFGNHKHISIASLSKEFANNTITCIAPSKTFNLAGMHTSAIIIPNKELRDSYMNTLTNLSLDKANLFGVIALETAYNKGESWLKELLIYLEGHVDLITGYIDKNIPEITYHRPEGTYLIWLDCSRLNMNDVELEDFMINKAKVSLRHGYHFGPGGEGFVRLNFACSKEMLEKGLHRIKSAIEDYKVTSVL